MADYVLSLDKSLKLEITLDESHFWKNTIYRMKLKRYIGQNSASGQEILFDETLDYTKMQKIIAELEKDAQKRGYTFEVTEKLLNFIEAKALYIEERTQVALTIKHQDDSVKKQFEKYEEVVNQAFERQLRTKQMWDSFFMATMKRACNFSVPGSGKTASVLGVFAYLQSIEKVKRMVVICPKNAFGSWEDEFRNCFGNKKELDLFNIQMANYSTKAQRSQGIRLETGNKNLLLFNFESLKGIVDDVSSLVDHETLLVVDEVHRVKAVGGKLASHVLSIASLGNYVIALSGTPIPNTYLDLQNLLKMLYQEEYESYFGFSEKFLKNPTLEEIDYINLKLQPVFCRTSKEELGVPAVNPDYLVPAEATKDESKLFHILTQKYHDNKLVLLLRIMQLSSNPECLLQKLDYADFQHVLDDADQVDDIDFVDFSEEIKGFIQGMGPSAKFKECVALAVEIFEKKKPFIIWCCFIRSISKLADELTKKGLKVACIYGEISLEERKIILDRFKSGKIDVLLTNPHTLAESVSLHDICHDAIYYEYTYNLVHLLQSKDRIHRLGLADDQYTQYYFLQQVFLQKNGIPFSLDLNIYKRLLQKEQTMLRAVEQGNLEQGTTDKDDIDFVLRDLKLDSI